ncbi:hypothetical protein AMAG_06962 [Allomyces macrogynus ATCC 38327]|uniref:Ribosomal protein S11 n=1 Tax=Allomyces macrogynus (strain ATCC 38327) TaxID=578462 RepID=A0A0L0SFK0_ALLM3|nr:hypothetical protein AMAG_06962 [Allomyces macrogynus ATCC 38327]|eukprot:KNE61214.1 hypothetical protein AMAG_06962 [Allomyces macrogynus ATCC 38327]
MLPRLLAAPCARPAALAGTIRAHAARMLSVAPDAVAPAPAATSTATPTPAAPSLPSRRRSDCPRTAIESPLPHRPRATCRTVSPPGRNVPLMPAGRAGIDYLSARPAFTMAPLVMHVQATFNNTLITITTTKGDAIASSSGGNAGFKKAQRAGYEPAYQAARIALAKVEDKQGESAKMHGVHVKFKGFGPGRDAAWKAVLALGWKVAKVEDVTPIAHGGCRPRKARRL